MPAAPASSAVCSLCGRARFGARWLVVPAPARRRLPAPQGLCPECLARALARSVTAFPPLLARPRPAA